MFRECFAVAHGRLTLVGTVNLRTRMLREHGGTARIVSMRARHSQSARVHGRHGGSAAHPRSGSSLHPEPHPRRRPHGGTHRGGGPRGGGRRAGHARRGRPERRDRDLPGTVRLHQVARGGLPPVVGGAHVPHRAARPDGGHDARRQGARVPPGCAGECPQPEDGTVLPLHLPPVRGHRVLGCHNAVARARCGVRVARVTVQLFLCAPRCPPA